MTFSTEIIRILDDLCRRFGIAIDWTSDNILPYLEDLCSRYIQYEIYTSSAWCAIMLAAFVIFLFCWLAAFIMDNTTKVRCSDAKEFFGVMTLIFLAIGLIVCSVQAFDIIECYTIPEKTIVEYISNLKNTR